MRSSLAGTLAAAVMLAGASVALAGTPDMDALWPNTDGFAWRYAQRTEVLYPSPSITDRRVLLALDGTAIAPGGIDVQVLLGQLESGPAPLVADAGRSAFARSLRLARPDLAAALDAPGAAGTCPTNAPPGLDAVLLTGNLAYRKTAAEIASWRCDIAATRSWQWLESNTAQGHSFELQLVPDLAADVRLTGTNGPLELVTVPAGTFVSCLRVDYVVDYGLSECTDSGGAPIGSYRSETRGSVYWATGVGPVKSVEEFVQFVEMTGACGPPERIGQPNVRVTWELTTLPVAARASTWGRLKTRYR